MRWVAKYYTRAAALRGPPPPRRGNPARAGHGDHLRRRLPQQPHGGGPRARRASRLPATIFLVTGTVGTDDRRLARPPVARLRAHVGAANRRARARPAQRLPRDPGGPRARLRHGHRRPEGTAARPRRTRSSASLLAALGERTPVDPGPFRALTWDDVAALQRTGLFEFGGHSVRHDILSRSDDADVAATIPESHREVASRTGVVPVAFAYPNGRSHRLRRACPGRSHRCRPPLRTLHRERLERRQLRPTRRSAASGSAPTSPSRASVSWHPVPAT